jgi:hypothetical protein
VHSLDAAPVNSNTGMPAAGYPTKEIPAALNQSA